MSMLLWAYQTLLQNFKANLHSLFLFNIHVLNPTDVQIQMGHNLHFLFGSDKSWQTYNVQMTCRSPFNFMCSQLSALSMPVFIFPDKLCLSMEARGHFVVIPIKEPLRQERIPWNLLYQASFFSPWARLLHLNNNRSITSTKWQIFEPLSHSPLQIYLGQRVDKGYKYKHTSSRWPNFSFVPRSLKVFPPDEDRMRSTFLLLRHHRVVLVQNFCWYFAWVLTAAVLHQMPSN